MPPAGISQTFVCFEPTSLDRKSRMILQRAYPFVGIRDRTTPWGRIERKNWSVFKTFGEI